MKEMKAPEKVAQKMTRDGAVAENLVTGEVDRISQAIWCFSKAPMIRRESAMWESTQEAG